MLRGYVTLGIIGAALLAWLIVQGPPPTPGDEDTRTGVDAASQAENAYRLFPFLAQPQDITGISLAIPAEDVEYTYVVEDANGTAAWRLRDPPFSPVNNGLANVIRQNLMFMPGLGAFERGEFTPEVLGFLPNPQYVISFQMVPDVSDIRTISVYVGDRTRSGQAYYASPTLDEGVVDLVPAEWIDSFVRAMQELQPADRQAGEDTPSPSP
ncbi:MAG: hypothetical protein ACLFTK_01840 [Anaerolineales bacterium]